jgi:SpoU rRNA methylase family enzyme
VYLRSNNILDVVRLEEALEVQDLELISLLECKELAERSIGLDDLLDHERVVLGIGADTGSDLRAAEESALGDTKECAERI